MVHARSGTISPDEVLRKLGAAGVVPVVDVDTVDAASPLGDCFLGAGLLCVEVTLRTPAALPVLRGLCERAGLLTGAGTVLDPAQVDRAVECGARFVVSPGFEPDVVARCRELGVAVLPGVATAGELLRARRYGLKAVKFFPAEQIGGLAALKALASTVPNMAFMPTGGIGPDNAASYLGESSVLAVGGSWMVPRDLLAQRAWPQVRSLCADAVRLADTARLQVAAREGETM